MKMMRVADYIAEFLANYGIRTIHGLTGGGAATLNDAFLKHDRLNYLSFHHEQAAAYAAYGVAKANQELAVVNPTTGCGGTNCMTPLLNAWQESVPVMFISGNTSTNTCTNSLNRKHGTSRKYFGTQEHDIINTVKSMTNYAAFVDNPKMIQYHLNKAAREAIGYNRSRRCGPVWLDIPSDVQSAMIDVESDEYITIYDRPEPDDTNLYSGYKIVEALTNSEKPLILIGNGLPRETLIEDFVEKYNIPVVTTYLARDVFDYEHHLNLGTIGIKGVRAANKALQNCDLLLVLGCSLSATHLGYDPEDFARNANILHIDTDSSVWLTNPISHRIDFIERPLQGILRDVHMAVNNLCTFKPLERKGEEWVDQCLEWKIAWNSEQLKHADSSVGMNLYKAIRLISNIAENSDIVTDAGSVSYALPQTWRFRHNQRLVFSSAQADMGCALPAAIGIAYQNKIEKINRKVYCFTGDGSLMSNLQELSTMKFHDLDITVIVINNNGYLSIRNTQKNYFNGNVGGTDISHGVAIPYNFEAIAEAFELDYVQIGMDKIDLTAFHGSGSPTIVEILCDPDQEIVPTQAKLHGVQQPLDNMYPFEGDSNEQVAYHRV